MICLWQTERGFGERSWRYSAVVNDRKIEKLFLEDGKITQNCEYDPYVFKKYSKTTLSVYRDGRREDDKVFNIPICSLKKIIL